MDGDVRTEGDLQVAVGQMAAGRDVDANLERIAGLTARAAARGARLIVFPEGSMFAWDASGPDIARAATEQSEAFRKSLGELAAQHRIAVVVGAYVPGSGKRARNRMVVFTADGVERAGYDKLHLYDAFAFRESDKVEAGRLAEDGSELVTIAVGGLTFGLLNCYDLRFPEMARRLVDKGADALVVSSAWVAGPHKELHWETLLRARAIENTCYVVAANQPGPASTGLSMVVDPMGVVLAGAVGDDDVAVAPLSPERLAEVRAVVPSLAQRRYRS